MVLQGNHINLHATLTWANSAQLGELIGGLMEIKAVKWVIS